MNDHPNSCAGRRRQVASGPLSVRYSAIWFLLAIIAPFAPVQLSAQPPAETSAKSQNGDAESLPREVSIYIPYDKLRAVIEREGRGVFLPYEKFQELWQAAKKVTIQPPDEGPPVESLITEIDSEATVAHDVMLVTAHIKIDVFKKRTATASGSAWISSSRPRRFISS